MANAEEQAAQLQAATSLDDEGCFAVVPLATCPHLAQVSAAPAVIDVHAPCEMCGVEGENWACLVCYKVHCSRYVSGHAVAHESRAYHPMALSFSDLSAWCYACEAYVHNDALRAAKDAAHRSKFGASQSR